MPEARSVITQPDFSKIFASAAAVGELLNWPSEDYLRGWGYLQPQEAPPMEYFNAFYNGTDTKLLYLFSAANIRKSSTAYQIDDIVTSPNLSSKYWLVCTQAGTTDANEPDYSEVDANEEITDGTAKFLVTLRVSQGIAVGETAPDNPREGDLWLQTSSTKKTAELKQRTSSGWAKVLIETILNAVTDSPIKTLERNAACNVNTVYAETTLPKGGFLICTQAGTTGASSATGFATAEEGSVITDGTAKFEVHYFDQIVSKINIFTGATSNLPGKAGLVPAPAASEQNKFLRGDGLWADAKMTAKDLVDVLYPVGSIYMSTNAANPGTLWPGTTWEAYAQGRVLIGAGTGTDSRSEQKTFAAGSTGGEYNHQLTVGEMPTHTHTAVSTNTGEHTHGIRASWADSSATPGLDYVDNDATGYTNSAGNHTHAITIADTGGGVVHNNQQPYITAYIWRRTA